ncbi:MAG TPA: alpha/beta hydrolase [Pyrinomonadaceae bacterium]|nr:alpha/beta hydrolase [Pyrinomonadaceae bacterium]
MKFSVLILLVLLAANNFMAQTSIRLWNEDAPNALGKEAVDIPEIKPFLAPKEKATGAAILVLPGGGYGHLSDVKEGSAVAEWLNSLGISAFVLKYRLGPKYGQPNQLLDAARALRTIRARAKEWNLDEKRIGILGFSAGGHLASTLSTHFDAGKLDAKDEIEKVSSRPDLQILIYPVVTMGEFTHQGSKKNLLGENPSTELIQKYSNELQVTKETPPAFLVHTMTDTAVPVENSLQYIAALRKNGVPFEFHLYEQGPHGFGLAPTNPYLNSWAERCADWLRMHNFAAKK